LIEVTVGIVEMSRIYFKRWTKLEEKANKASGDQNFQRNYFGFIWKSCSIVWRKEAIMIAMKLKGVSL